MVIFRNSSFPNSRFSIGTRSIRFVNGEYKTNDEEEIKALRLGGFKEITPPKPKPKKARKPRETVEVKKTKTD